MAIEPKTEPASLVNETHTKTNEIWEMIEQLKSGAKILLDGSDLDIASVVAVAK